jgi:ribose 5-phosphate isomerase B
MKIALACDHGAFEHKEAIKLHLLKKGHQVQDFGTHNEESMDYPDTVYPASCSVADASNDFGIVLCGTGIGASIVANKVKGVRCALVYDPKVAEITRMHNDTNVLALGGRLTSVAVALEIVDKWLGSSFSQEERHKNRIDKICRIEETENDHE